MNLSPTKISTFETCSMQFKYRYIDKWQPAKENANFKFGSCIHTALEEFFMNGIVPAKAFEEAWLEYKNIDLNYSRHDTWEKLNETGKALMNKFTEEEAHKFIKVHSVEEMFKFKVNQGTTFWGRGDLIGLVELPNGDRANAIIDFKTAGRKYKEYEANMNDQLTAYYYAGKKYDFNIDKVIFVILVKTKIPQIQWVIGERNDIQTQEYLDKVNDYYQRIMEGKFYKEYGLNCNWCDYQALCLGDKQRVKEELVIKEEVAE